MKNYLNSVTGLAFLFLSVGAVSLPDLCAAENAPPPATGAVSAARTIALDEESGPTGKVYRVRHPAYTLEIRAGEGARAVLSEPGKAAAADEEMFRPFFGEDKVATPQDLAWEVAVREKSEKAVTIEATATLPEAVGADLSGCVLTRRFKADVASPWLDVEIVLRNPTNVAKYAVFGIINKFRVGESKQEICFLPTTRNILDVSASLAVGNGFYGKGGPWEYEPVEAWMAVADRSLRKAKIFLLDDTSLESFYTAAGGGAYGWYYSAGFIPAGGEVKTFCATWLGSGFDAFSHVSRRLVTDIKVRTEGKTLAIEHIAAAPDGLGKISIDSSILGARAGKQERLPPVAFGALGPAPSSQTVACPGKWAEAVVVKAVAKAEGLDENYESYFEGNYKTIDMPGYPLKTVYQRPPRRPAARTNNVFNAATVKRGNGALLFFGLYTQFYKYQEFLKGREVKISNAKVERAEFIPTPLELSRYALVVLSDVNVKSLSGAGVQRIEEYVRNGGGLLVLGGPFAFGEGEYQKAGLDEILSVTSAPFDLKKSDGLPLVIKGEHAITRESTWEKSKTPCMFWLHRVGVKKDAQVLMTAGKSDPLLVISRHGAGRVAVFLGTPLGEPKPGQMPFWEWPGWAPLMARTADWLTGKIE